MCHRFVARVLALLTLTLTPNPAAQCQGREIDRILAAVNGRIVTVGDLRVARDLNALLRLGREDAQEPMSEEKEVERLIDLELIRQELESFPLGTEDRAGIESRLAELTEAYIEIGGLRRLLQRLGLLEEELRAYVRLQASILRFVDLRFRPFASVSAAEIERYYQERFVPKLQAARAAISPLDEVKGQIEKILQEEKVNIALENWIGELRKNAKVEKLGSSPPSP